MTLGMNIKGLDTC